LSSAILPILLINYEPLRAMLEGDWVGGILSVYTSTVGIAFFGLILIAIAGAAYLRSGNVAAPMVLICVMSVAFAAWGVLPAGMEQWLYLLVVLSASVVIWAVFRR